MKTSKPGVFFGRKILIKSISALVVYCCVIKHTCIYRLKTMTIHCFSNFCELSDFVWAHSYVCARSSKMASPQVCWLGLADGSAFSFMFSVIRRSIRRVFQKIKGGSFMASHSGILPGLSTYTPSLLHILLIKASHSAVPDQEQGKRLCF